MGYVYNQEEKLLLMQCVSCGKIMEYRCDRKLYDRINDAGFKFADASDLEDTMRHAVTMGICDGCFQCLSKKKE